MKKIKDKCQHKQQHYTQGMSDYGCFAFNECNNCGERLNPDIGKAEECKNEI